MLPVTAADLFAQGASTIGAARAVSAFAAAPGAQTAFQVAGRLVGVIGTDRIVGALVRHGLRLVTRSRALDRAAGPEMVEAMRARVPQDTGTLFSGITSSEEGGVVTVEASAENPRADDYARFVEYGTRPGLRGGSLSYAADEGFFSGQVRPTPRTRRVYRTHPGTKAQPFFWPGAREVLERRGRALADLAAERPAELR
ncbi:MAG TPA: HK97-gp10 family putative phage morphogenesis protein [Beijerinckiaceae bacterium]|nr:HK97-gp10 family putative phage morphogenesis protein [Beijerinckiaceae bacterium]